MMNKIKKEFDITKEVQNVRSIEPTSHQLLLNLLEQIKREF